MSLILSGTDGLSDVDGTAATPAIRGTDANTGIFFPAADTIAFSEGGVEAARFDSAGNFGLGVTPNVQFSGIKALQIGSTTNLYDNGASTKLYHNAYTAASGDDTYLTTGYAQGYLMPSNGQHIWYTSASGTAGNVISFTQAMTLDASGRLGIGTATPDTTTLMTVAGAVTITGNNTGHGASRLKLGQDTSAISQIRFYGVNAATAGILQFTGSSSDASVGGERMRIDSSGNLLVGTTSNVAVTARTAIVGDASTGGLAVEASGSGSGYPVWFRDTDATSASQQMVHFRRGASNVGFITTTNTTTSYGSASDYRLKEDITPMTGALAKVALFKPCTYKWKIDGSVGEGFIAHELQEVCPIAVHGTKDGIDADGKPDYQAIDTSFLVATLTAAIQEQQALITTLTARITALETPAVTPTEPTTGTQA